MKKGLFALIALTIMVILFAGCNQNSDKKNEDEGHVMAYIMAKDFVKQQLKSPSSADFPIDYSWGVQPNSNYVIKSYVDSQNGFGATIRSNFYIKLKFKGGEEADIQNWEVVDLKMQ